MKLGVRFTGALQVTPLSVDRANPVLFVRPDGKRVHATYAFAEPLPANRSDDPCPSAAAAATTRRAANVGVPVSTLSEYVQEISTPPDATGVKFDQQRP